MPLLIFDMGGVMVDGFDVAPGIAATLGLPEPELRAELDAAGARALHDGAITAGEFWERFEANTRRQAPGELWREEFKPIRRPAMYALVTELKSAGLRVVAGTNTIAPHYEVHQERGDYGIFDRVYASHLMGVSKPEPAFWLTILEAEGVAPHEALFLDDLPENVAAAAALGVRSVLWTDFEQVRGALSGLLGELA